MIHITPQGEGKHRSPKHSGLIKVAGRARTADASAKRKRPNSGHYPASGHPSAFLMFSTSCKQAGGRLVAIYCTRKSHAALNCRAVWRVPCALRYRLLPSDVRESSYQAPESRTRGKLACYAQAPNHADSAGCSALDEPSWPWPENLLFFSTGCGLPVMRTILFITSQSLPSHHDVSKESSTLPM